MMIEPRKFIPSVIDYDIPPLHKWFFDYIGKDISEFDDNHPLNVYNTDYEKWANEKFQLKSDFRIPIPASLMEFANFMRGVQFCSTLIEPVKAEFISDISEKKCCYGIFFEIRILVNYYNFQKYGFIEHLAYRNVEIEGKKPDISFTNSGSFRRIYLECTRKCNRDMRCNDDEVLMRDLLWSLKDKAEKYRGLKAPVIYAVHVPEIIQFKRDDFREELGTRLQNTLKDPLYHNVNYVAFSSYQYPELISSGQVGKVYYETDFPNLVYPNASVSSTLKEDLSGFLFNT